MLDLIPGTGSSNPPPSSGESANFRFLASIIPTRKELARVAVLNCPGGFLYPIGASPRLDWICWAKLGGCGHYRRLSSGQDEDHDQQRHIAVTLQKACKPCSLISDRGTNHRCVL